jgi:transposase
MAALNIIFEGTVAIQTELKAIFLSLELSRATWVITSLSPQRGEKMSKHSVPGGDIAGLWSRFTLLQERARGRTGKVFPFVGIQEARLDDFWIHKVLEKASRATLSIQLP